MHTDQSFSKQAMVLILARGIAVLVTMAIPLILVRYLTQTEFGAYKQTILLYMTAISLLPWGMAQSLYYFIPQEPQHRAGYLSNTFLFLISVGTLSLIGFIFAGPYLETYFHSKELADNSWLIGVFIFFTLASIHWEIVLVSENRASTAAGTILLSEVIKAVSLMGGAFIARSFTGVVIALAFAATSRFILLSITFYQDFKLMVDWPNIKLFSKQWQYSMPFGLMILLIFIQDYFHQYYVSYSLSPIDFAIYSIGVLQLPVIDLFYSSIGDVAMVKMTEQLRTNNLAELRRIWHDAILKLNLIFLPLTIYLLVVSEIFIISLFTTSYKASIPIFIVSTISILFQGLLVDPVMRVLGETRSMLLIAVVRMPITIILVVVSLAYFGLIGVAASTVFTTLILRTMMLIRIGSVMNIKMKDILPWAGMWRILAVAISAAFPTLIILALPFPTKVLLFLATLVYGVSYLIVGLWTDIFPAEEQQMVKDTINKVVLSVSAIFHKLSEPKNS